MLQKAAIIGIIGGMGPEAGRILHGLIIEETKKLRHIGQDQDHCDVLHFALPSIIPDRATYIFDQNQPNPVDVLIEIVKGAVSVGKQFKRPIISVVPCNTFHAPILFNDLMNRIKQEEFDEWFILYDFVKETVLGIAETFPNIKKVGLLSTSGTRKTLIYAQALEAQGIELIQVANEEQIKVDDAIYNPVDGLKALSKASERTKELLRNYVHTLRYQGAERVILGCTEFPLAFEDLENAERENFIDPMRIVARRLIQMAYRASPQ
ncbi:hypothetical protein IM40_08885 [Candidatus Paracaedimonas acanthamoebae]|nr:hypothetical protein IM40_08885 [Candidatus Paracaedimonas acanthamoebae]